MGIGLTKEEMGRLRHEGDQCIELTSRALRCIRGPGT
jgi:hypothetical protein